MASAGCSRGDCRVEGRRFGLSNGESLERKGGKEGCVLPGVDGACRDAWVVMGLRRDQGQEGGGATMVDTEEGREGEGTNLGQLGAGCKKGGRVECCVHAMQTCCEAQARAGLLVVMERCDCWSKED